MAFAFITPASRELLPSSLRNPFWSERAYTALRKDYERWSRWFLGVACYFGILVGILFAVALSGTLLAESDWIGAFIAVVFGSAFAVPSGYGLIRLWSSGRRLLQSASVYMRQSAPQRSAHGWLEARVVVYEGPILVRILTSSATGLLAVFGLTAAFAPVYTPGEYAFAAAVFAVGAVSALACVAQMGGTMRVSSILAERDPLWVRIRGWFSRTSDG